MSLSKLRIGIVGLGQIGGSIATRLSTITEPPVIVGYDLRSDLLYVAKERHIITGIAISETELVESSDIVVIALPIGEVLAFLRRHQDSLKQKLAVTDTGSLKLEVTHLAAELGLCNFVGGHPLAGTEKRGVDSWNTAIFEGASYFLTRVSSTDEKAILIVADLATALGAHAVPVDPEQHDQIFAVTSGLPHVIAYSLLQMFDAIPEGDTDKSLFRAPSFAGATRVTGSDPEMVFQALWHNRANLSGSLATLIERLLETRGALDEQNEVRFRQLLGLTKVLQKFPTTN